MRLPSGAVVVSALAILGTLGARAFAQWTPRGALAKVPVVENCNATGGDIAVARPGPMIIYCQARADQLNAQFPGAGHFYYVHEFGHVALNTADEARADCWAAQQLRNVQNGRQVLDAALRHFVSRQNEPVHPRYGPMLQRAQRIANCAGIPMPSGSSATPAMGRSCCTPYGKCGPFYNQPALPIGAVCNCGGGYMGQVCN
ncbi:MAG: O-acetyl-ADP-ribose deacetylase [Thermoanaerobaculia bacterium]|jgi:hypothetical protein|nr:O-acetyl-ADP-ribose deacetylase [Thermoanaerobaculia bacterium]